MSEDRPRVPGDQEKPEPGLTPDPAADYREGDVIHTAPEFAIADADVLAPERGDVIAGTSLWRDAWRRLLRNKLAVFGMIVVAIVTVASILGPYLIKLLTGVTPDYIPTDVALLKSIPPLTAPDGSFSWTHPMGTDNQGRDLLARVLQGGQISLMVGIIATLVSLVIGVSYGATAGYLGGRIDNLMMRLVDVLYSLPYIIIVIVLLSVFRSQTARGQIVLLFIALGSVSWLTMARIVRGQVLSLKNQEFVLAARATGVSTPRIIFRHIVPNTLGPVIVYATLTIPTVMLTEAFLSFLGFGVQPPLASW
ncbi:MAG: ABC transporter permease, partial [Acidobacteria bacterium]|nr:ABC transporter permease [Acidobacteriota bacterium]